VTGPRSGSRLADCGVLSRGSKLLHVAFQIKSLIIDVDAEGIESAFEAVY
jgi:hypothetical protein